MGLPPRPTVVHRLIDDHFNFYSPRSLAWLGGGLLAGAAFANTDIDESLQRHFQSSVKSANSDEWYESLHANKELGNGIYTLPVMATAWAAGAFFPDVPILNTTGRWGERSLRAFLVGAPLMIAFQHFTGGSRPSEMDYGSRWHPFADDNGVSGHSFMSALPFLTAAQMADNPFAKTAFYAGSLLGPLSRMNDNAHFPSQIFLGWWFAYLATVAVSRTEFAGNVVQFQPLLSNDSFGGMFEFRF